MIDFESYSNDFAEAAALSPKRRTITVNIDADVLQYMEAEGVRLNENINGLLRFYMEPARRANVVSPPTPGNPAR